MKAKVFGIGFLSGLALASLMFFVLEQAVLQPKIVEANSASRKMSADLASCRVALDGEKKVTELQQHIMETSLSKPQVWTVIFERTQNGGGAELLNLVRPGLGTLLAKMAPAGVTPHWLFPGDLKPAVQGDAQGAVYYHVNGATQDIQGPFQPEVVQ